MVTRIHDLNADMLRKLAEKVEQGHLQISLGLLRDDGTTFNPLIEDIPNAHGIGAIEFAAWDGENPIGPPLNSATHYFDQIDDSTNAVFEVLVGQL